MMSITNAVSQRVALLTSAKKSAASGGHFLSPGSINGKPTTKTISEEVARECQKRIKNYKELQKKIDKIIAEAIDQAPWTQRTKK